MYNFVTPKDFLNLINQFLALREELRSKIEEQQVHVKKGLIILKNTEKSLSEMDASLQQYQQNLNLNMKMASDKMSLI